MTRGAAEGHPGRQPPPNPYGALLQAHSVEEGVIPPSSENRLREAGGILPAVARRPQAAN